MNEVIYESFFDELGHIEKEAMLEKVAVWGAMKGAYQGVKRGVDAIRSGGLASAVGKVTSAYKAGAAPAIPQKGGVLRGIKSALGTDEGKAMAAGVGGAALGVGGLGAGAGYLAGRKRSSANPNQNVYVR